MKGKSSKKISQKVEKALLPYWLEELIEKGRFSVKYSLFSDDVRYFVYEDKNLKGIK